jgi:hypothetical protein
MIGRAILVNNHRRRRRLLHYDDNRLGGQCAEPENNAPATNRNCFIINDFMVNNKLPGIKLSMLRQRPAGD